VPFTKVRGLNWSFQNFKDEIDPLSTVQGRSCLFRLLFGWHPSSRSACDASPNLLCPCWLAGSPRTSRKQAAQHHVIPELPTTEPVNVCCLALAACCYDTKAGSKGQDWNGILQATPLPSANSSQSVRATGVHSRKRSHLRVRLFACKSLPAARLSSYAQIDLLCRVWLVGCSCFSPNDSINV
jgi:hypothetical protein